MNLIILSRFNKFGITFKKSLNEDVIISNRV